MAVLMPMTGRAIQQRTAAYCRVERGVGLDHVVDQMTGDAAQGYGPARSRPGCHGRVEPERAAVATTS